MLKIGGHITTDTQGDSAASDGGQTGNDTQKSHAPVADIAGRIARETQVRPASKGRRRKASPTKSDRDGLRAFDTQMINAIPAAVLNGSGDPIPGASGSGDAQMAHDTHQLVVISAHIETIRAAHRAAVFAMKQQSVIDHSMRAFIRSALGFRIDLPEKQRAEITKQAGRIIKSSVKLLEAALKRKANNLDFRALVELDAGEIVHADDKALVSTFGHMIATSEQSRAPWDDIRNDNEKIMVKALKQLPIHGWYAPIRGLGDMSIARIIGECGDIGSYKSVAAVWKRMGVAVINGGRQRCVSGDAALDHGYSPRRRSVLWNLGEPIIKVGGPYREVYDNEKTRQEALHPELTKAHRHNRAKRYMEKRILRDLWVAWRRGAIRCAQTNVDAPLSELSEAA